MTVGSVAGFVNPGSFSTNGLLALFIVIGELL